MTDAPRTRCFAILATPVLVVAALVAYSSGPGEGPETVGRTPWVQQFRAEFLPGADSAQDVPALDREQAGHEGDDGQAREKGRTGPVPSVHDGDLNEGPAKGRDLR